MKVRSIHLCWSRVRCLGMCMKLALGAGSVLPGKGKFEAGTTTHALAEVWGTLTAIPVEPRIAPASTERVIERLARHIKPVALRWDDYKSAMQRCGERGLRSGALYDALHFVAAARQEADILLTFNTRHFIPLATDDGPRIAHLIPQLFLIEGRTSDRVCPARTQRP